MGTMYTIEFSNDTLTAAETDMDAFYIAPADDRKVTLHAVFIEQESEIGDAQEEFMRYKIIRGHATVGSGGTSATPVALDPDAAAADATCRVNDTTPASAGTPLDVHSGTFNVRSGLVLIFTPEMRPVVTQASGATIVVRILSTVTDDIQFSGTLYFEEG